ncbi:MAG: M48 family metallopeptidase [Hyphomicrobium sp.]|nr:M48 family metallopeptidase [Hyphomicrobium sp.]
MSVEVVAPRAANDADVRQRVTRRGRWILRQMEFFRQFHPKTPMRRYEPGETHLYLGRTYRLKFVKSDTSSVKIIGSRIVIGLLNPTDRDAVRTQLDAWQKAQARVWFERRLLVCIDRFSDKDKVAPKALIVRQLKLRWGSMSQSGRLLLNRSLIGAAKSEIDYVITHELCHRVYHHHGAKFYELLDRVMPDWRKRKQSLERRLA